MASRYDFECIELLRNELLFAPTRIRRRNIFRLERLISAVKPDRKYPYDYVHHKITNYRPDRSFMVMMAGEDLLKDLLRLLGDLSESIDIKVADTGEPVLTVPDMMARYGVSAKTIYRWRKKGLVGYEFLFEDGKKRIGFKLSNVQEFEERYKDRISKSSAFTLVEEEEKRRMIDTAREIIESGNDTFSDVAAAVSEKVGRSRETIRHMLKRHDQENPDHRLFPDMKGPLSESDKEAIFRLYEIGVPMRALCKEYRRNRSSVYRIIYKIKTREVLSDKIDYVYNSTFDDPGVEMEVLGDERKPAKPRRGSILDKEAAEELPIYLRDLHNKSRLLTREEEQTLFRRFNYLKHRMSVLRERLKVVGARAEIINEIAELYNRAVEIKQRLIQANLRLVVSIAKRHSSRNMDFNTLVSDGNLSLMQAVEKFDYSRGNRFSTYASWALIKNYAKSIPEESSIRETFRTSEPEVLDLASGGQESRPSRMELVANFKKLLSRLLRNLTEREREVIVARFGLREKTGPATLEEIGSSFDLSKERIRQIEAKALRKLRSELDIDQVESLLQ